MNAGKALRRAMAIGAAVFLSASAGCTSQEQYDNSIRLNAQLQKDKDQLDAAVRDRDQQLRAERDRAADLERKIKNLETNLQQAANVEQQLRKSLEGAKSSMQRAMTQMDQDSANLRRTLEAQEKTRLRWEQELADRDKQIDQLKSAIKVLREELDKVRSRPAATTKP